MLHCRNGLICSLLGIGLELGECIAQRLCEHYYDCGFFLHRWYRGNPEDFVDSSAQMDKHSRDSCSLSCLFTGLLLVLLIFYVCIQWNPPCVSFSGLFSFNSLSPLLLIFIPYFRSTWDPSSSFFHLYNVSIHHLPSTEPLNPILFFPSILLQSPSLIICTHHYLPSIYQRVILLPFQTTNNCHYRFCSLIHWSFRSGDGVSIVFPCTCCPCCCVVCVQFLFCLQPIRCNLSRNCTNSVLFLVVGNSILEGRSAMELCSYQKYSANAVKWSHNWSETGHPILGLLGFILALCGLLLALYPSSGCSEWTEASSSLHWWKGDHRVCILQPWWQGVLQHRSICLYHYRYSQVVFSQSLHCSRFSKFGDRSALFSGGKWMSYDSVRVF